MRPLALATTAWICACGGTSAGGGSGTLSAKIEVALKSDSTKISVDLHLKEQPVRGANVVATDWETEAQATLEDKQGGRYETILHGYVRTVAIKVTSGDDELDGRLEGPAPFEITRPPANAIVRRGDSDVLSIEWASEAAAERVEIRAEGVEPVTLEEDLFHYDLPLGLVQNGDQKLSIARETAVDLAGGTEGSRMRARSEVDNRFTLE
ncbi:MAG: hypothetical protein HY791_37185 [Deltaproteobacteria bacterium]|nr:hypothetical protein [Deltaproteobacteria bacterium]